MRISDWSSDVCSSDLSSSLTAASPRDKGAISQRSRRGRAVKDASDGTVTPTCEDLGMAFGQQSGPPATHRQVQQLTELLQAAGHSDFRDAHHPLGLTQRQAGGKFTRDEADDLIARLDRTSTRLNSSH